MVTDSMYKKTYYSKIVRTKHELTFRRGMNARDLAAELLQVPGYAKIIEIVSNLESDDNCACIEFQEDIETPSE